MNEKAPYSAAMTSFASPAERAHPPALGYVYATLVVAIWTGFILVSRAGGVSMLTPWDVIAIRYATAAALLLPLLLSALPGTLSSAAAGDSHVLATIALVLVPLALAQGIRRLAPGIHARLRGLRRMSFPLWIAALVLASARTSRFLSEHPEIPRSLVAVVFAVALLAAPELPA